MHHHKHTVVNSGYLLVLGIYTHRNAQTYTYKLVYSLLYQPKVYALSYQNLRKNLAQTC